MMKQPRLDTRIFRKYDIRGIVDVTLSEDIVYRIGRGFGSTLRELGETNLILARDTRLSSPAYANAFSQALINSGINVIDLGAVPTPLANFATHTLGIPNAAIITGSHNPANYNGLKLVVRRMPWHGQHLKDLRQRVQAHHFIDGSGQLKQYTITPSYLGDISQRVKLNRSLRVAVDSGNGIAGPVASALLKRLGCQVHELFCKPDGRFPNHHPNPSVPENLRALQQTVIDHRLDAGLALDGDGDRLGVVDSSGKIIWPDRQLMLFAESVLQERPGSTIIYDVKSSCHLQRFITRHGGKPLMIASGHSLLREKMRELDAPLGGELSGHIFFADHWYGFDDALYSAARLLKILSAHDQPSAEVFAALPDSPCTPEITIDFGSEDQLDQFMDALSHLDMDTDLPVSIQRIDGLRLEFPNGWGLIRASNTTPSLSLRFEADDEPALEQIQASVKRTIHELAPDILLQF